MVLALLCCSGCVGAPPRPAVGFEGDGYRYLKERMRYELQRGMRERDVVSYAIAVIDGEEIVWEEGFGHANLEFDHPASTDSIYRVGSISKLFTAIAVMRLVEAGKVDLDAPLVRYLPSFTLRPPPPWQPGADRWRIEDITVRAILTHHSGIPGDLLKGMFSPSPLPFTDYLWMLGQEHAAARVGLILAYSNQAMNLLGILVQEVSGVPFADYVEQEILRPCGMERASFRFTDEVRTRLAFPYKEGKLQPNYHLGPVAAGALHASVHEMALFARALLAGGVCGDRTILAEARLREMWQRHNGDVPLDLEQEMGLGFLRNVDRFAGGGLNVMHNGVTVYHRAELSLLPDHGLAVVLLSNSAEARSRDLTRLALQLAFETKTGIPQPVPEPEAGVDEKVPAPQLATVPGHYETALGHLHIRRDGDRLRTHLLGEGFELQPLRTGGFQLGFKLFGLIPIPVEQLDRLVLSFESKWWGCRPSCRRHFAW